jgi:thiamine biosynthesis lipoprotein
MALLLDPVLPGGEIALLNAVPSHVWIAVSAETARALRRAREVADASGGYYEPTLGPVLRAWGVGRVASADPSAVAGPALAPRVPALGELNHALRKVGFEQVEVRDGEDAARRTSRHVQLDLGALGRGATVDAALARLRAGGVPAALVECGSERAAYGGTAERPWLAALAHPETAAPLGEIAQQGGGLAVVAPHPARVGDALVHDQIDPWTGWPARGERLVAVAAPDAASAGAWAAAIFAMGAEGPGFAAAHPGEGLECLALLESGELAVTPGLALRRAEPERP